MAAGLASPDVLARAVVEKVPATGGKPSQEAARRVRGQVAKDGPRSALNAMRRPEAPKNVRQRNEQNIGTAVKADGTKDRPVGSPVEARYKKAESDRKLAEDFLEKGYDGLSVGDKPKLEAAFRDVIMKWPEGAALFTGSPPPLNAAAQHDAIEALLRNPDFAHKVAKALQETQATPLDDEVTAAKKLYEDAVAKEKKTKDAVAVKDAERIGVNNRLKDFDRDPISGKSGAKLKELEDLQKTEPLHKITIKTNEKSLTARSKVLELLEINRADASIKADAPRVALLQGQIDAELTKVHDLELEIEIARGEIQKCEDLKVEKANLEKSKTTLTEEIDELRLKEPDEMKDRLAKQADFNSKDIARAAAEEEYVKSLEDVFKTGATELLEDQVEKSEVARQRLIDEEKANTKDPDELKILQAVQERWDMPQQKGRRTVMVIDKVQTKEDYGDLMERGPKALLRSILTKGLNPGNPADAAEITRVDAKLNSDPEFVSSMQKKLVERLLTRHVQSGGKIYADDIRILEESDWGKGAIEAAVNKRNDLEKKVDAILGKEGSLNRSFWEKMKRITGGNGLLAMMLLFGGVVSFGLLPKVFE